MKESQMDFLTVKYKTPLAKGWKKSGTFQDNGSSTPCININGSVEIVRKNADALPNNITYISSTDHYEVNVWIMKKEGKVRY